MQCEYCRFTNLSWRRRCFPNTRAQSAVASAMAQPDTTAARVLLEIVKPFAPPPIHLFTMLAPAASANQQNRMSNGGVSNNSSSVKYAQSARSAVDPQLQYLDSKSKSSMKDVVMIKTRHSEWGFSLTKQIITPDMDVSSFSAATYAHLYESAYECNSRLHPSTSTVTALSCSQSCPVHLPPHVASFQVPICATIPA